MKFAPAQVVSATASEALDTARASAAALQQQFGPAIRAVQASCGQLVVTVEPGRAREILEWLYSDAGQAYHYLCDVTAVEHRDPERPFEVVYQLRSLHHGSDLRVKIPLDPAVALEVATVTDLWSGADWLEREVFDMFGVRFRGHPDLRRILMWQTYDEGYPLRKSFPLRGHRSRSEQTRHALLSNPEAHYTLEELSIVEAYHDLPEDVRARLIQDGRVSPA